MDGRGAGSRAEPKTEAEAGSRVWEVDAGAKPHSAAREGSRWQPPQEAEGLGPRQGPWPVGSAAVLERPALTHSFIHSFGAFCGMLPKARFHMGWWDPCSE